MKELLKKVAYLRGYVDGLDLDAASDEGKVLAKLIDVVDALSDAIVQVNDEQEELKQQIQAIDEDLGELEEDFYEDYDAEDDADDDLDYFEIECPNCKEKVYIDDAFFDNGEPVVCPNCDEEIELDFSCDCGCEAHDNHQAEE